MNKHIRYNRASKQYLRVAVIITVMMASITGLIAQSVTARLDFGRKDPLPRSFEYISADKSLVTLGNSNRKSSRYLSITKYNESFNGEWSKQVIAQNGKNNVDLMAVVGDGIYVFISEYFPRTRTIKTFYSLFDLDGNIIAENEVLAELPNEKEHKVDLKYTRSLNKKKLLCYKNLNNNNKQEKILYYLFDAESEEIISSEIEIPYPDDKFQVKKILVSNTGFVYLLGKFYKENRITSPDDFSFQIYRFFPGSTEGDYVNVELAENLFITDLTLRVDRNENIFLAGFYSERATNAIAGTIYQRINPDFEIEVNSTQPFSEDFMARFLSDRQIERGRELKNFYLDNIIMRSDGGCLLIAEKFYTSYNSYLDLYGVWVDQKVYHYEDIIVNSVSGEGELEWSAVVRKQQVGENTENLSYLDVVAGSNLYLMYQYQPRKSPQTIYYNSIDMDGNVSNRDIVLHMNTAFDESFYPKSSEQISNHEALIFFYQNREKIYTIAKVDFSG